MSGMLQWEKQMVDVRADGCAHCHSCFKSLRCYSYKSFKCEPSPLDVTSTAPTFRPPPRPPLSPLPQVLQLQVPDAAQAPERSKCESQCGVRVVRAALAVPVPPVCLLWALCLLRSAAPGPPAVVGVVPKCICCGHCTCCAQLHLAYRCRRYASVRLPWASFLLHSSAPGLPL